MGLIAGELAGQKLDGDMAVEANVFCLIDHSHAAAAESFQNQVIINAASQ